MKKVSLPLDDRTVRSLEKGDYVLIGGTLVTARDRAHKWLFETFVAGKVKPGESDLFVYERLKGILSGGAIYHCGPVIKKTAQGWEILAAGPTTSERDEPYAAAIMKHFSVRLIIGKGGMGGKTQEACREVPAVYLQAVGGAGVVAARRVKRVVDVLKPEFGMPEAMWVLEVEDFPAVVTMDAKGQNLHRDVLMESEKTFQELISR